MIYELCYYSKKRLSLIPHDLRYFNTHFNCRSLQSEWEVPPVTIYPKSYKVADFVGWMLMAPVVSDRTKQIITSALKVEVEFLPFHSLKGRPYYAMNVMSLDPTSAIFKKTTGSVVYVSDEFGDMACDAKLTGLVLADPDAENGRMIVRGLDTNVFKGLTQ